MYFQGECFAMSGFYDSCSLAMCHLIHIFTTGSNVGINEHETLILISGKKEGCFF